MLSQFRGLVLAENPWGESDKILTVLTAEAGKISVLLKGGASLRNKSAASCIPFCFSEFVTADRGGRPWVREASEIESFPRIRKNLELTSAALYICDVAGDVCVENSDESEMLQLVLNTLYAGKLAGETNFFGKKVKWMGGAAALLEFVHVGLSVFSFYILFSFMRPEYCDPITTADGLFGGAEFVSSKLPVGMRWMLTADTVCDILIYVFYLFLLLAMCMMFYSFYRKYYARSPFIMMFLSALLPFRGFVIFAVRNNTPVDYDAWMRQRMEEFSRRQQQGRPGNYGGYGGYSGPQDGSGTYGDSAQGNEPFSDFGGPNSSNGSNGSNGSGGGGSPFSDF